jgi:hypothetical protein
MSTILSEKAMLAKLSISKWSARKHDKSVSQEVARNHGTDQDRGRFNKVLVAQEALKAIQKADGAARTYHYTNTLPWKDDGARILPASNYMEYTAEMRRLKSEFEAAVNDFFYAYPALIEQARYDLNGLFNSEDYPSADRIGRKFGFEVEVDPLPTALDFRVELQREEVARIRERIEERLQAAQTLAMGDLFTRLYDVVKHAAEKLNDKTAIFRDSLITNIQDLVDLLPRLNLTDDPRLETLRQEVSAKLLGYDPEDLRKNQFARKETAQAANDILAAMAGYTDAQAA